MLVGWMFSRTADSFTFPVFTSELECIQKGREQFLERSFFVAKGTLYRPEISKEHVKELLQSLNETIWEKTGVDDGLKLKGKKLESLTVTLNGAFQNWLDTNERRRLSWFWQIEEAKPWYPDNPASPSTTS